MTLLLLLLVFPSVSFAEVILERKIALGGQLTGGNTQVQSLHLDFKLNQNTKWRDETSISGSFDQSLSSGSETQNKIYTAFRYGHSLNNKYYSFYKLEAEQDRFQSVNFRIIPTVGMGYWFSDAIDFKSMLEAAIGYQRVYLVNQTEEELIILALTSKLDWGWLSNDFNAYVAPSDFNNYRFINTTDFKINLNQYYAFKWILKDEYNNQPASGIQKNDLSFMTSLEYSFKEVKLRHY